MTETAGTYGTEFFVRWLEAVAEAVEREADRLTELDAAIGDADHGANLRRGFTAVRKALDEEPPTAPGAVLVAAGKQLISTVGGASGPLYGTLLRRAGKALGDDPRVTRERFAVALGEGVEAVSRLGGARPGDKTMLDALVPGAEGLKVSFAEGRDRAGEGALGTVPLRARKGRASYLGERSAGHEDPGAASSALLFAALAATAGAEGTNGTTTDGEGAA
ncbi:dihydroxyacetone kinase subunit DhaL [Streptomyces gulbargensis]|uniref:Dihydroxyacetone kinase subunit DhaL n=1 Tax=Streptomyces gulbargensis TaxID=364901 RepID=A0ABP7N9Z7_9ACTN